MCPECRREHGHAMGCPMVNVSDYVIGRCAICGERIYSWELRVEGLTEDWDFLHTKCIDRLIDDHLVSDD